VGWTIRPAQKGTPPVDWSKWDRTDPDKLLRLYDWQCYGYQDKLRLPYEVVDFVFDAHTGKTAKLHTRSPHWTGKRDGSEMTAVWYSGMDGLTYGLVENGQGGFGTENFWLVSLSETEMQVKDLKTAMRNAVNGILRERRPEIAAGDFAVSFTTKSGDDTHNGGAFAKVPFVANAPVSDQKEFQLSGALNIRFSDGAVVGAVSDAKRLEPFLNNEELRKADGELNAIFQAALKSMSPKDAASFKQKERDWIAQRDADASQAVNIMPYGSTQQASEQARENSLLESTKKRIQELKDLIPVDRRPTP
jgi:uncharacterized protein YecT (DUF1311 family)